MQHYHDPTLHSQLSTSNETVATLSLFAEQEFDQSTFKVSGIVHDFNNLLAIILTHTTLALNKLPADNPARSHLERAVRTARRTAELSSQLLADMKSRRVESALLDLNHVILETVDLLNPRLTPRAQVALYLSSNLYPVLANDAQLQQVIMNLLLNALESITSPTGQIIISTNNITVPETRHDVPNQPPAGDYVCLQVEDNGAGLDQTTMEHIFEPFFTTKPTGTGIGLTTTLGIVHSHQGGMQVFSQPGRGTTFRVLLPAVEEEEF